VASYDPRFPKSPVPLARQVEVLKACADRWWDFFDAAARRGTNQLRDSEPYKIFDVDVALQESQRVMELLAEIAKHVGDESVIAALERWRDKVQAQQGEQAA
jgi:hypothetical protein